MSRTGSAGYAYRVLPRTVMFGAFPSRSGPYVRFSAGRGRRTVPVAAFNEVDVPKWPAAARLTLMLSCSVLLWAGIAAFFASFA